MPLTKPKPHPFLKWVGGKRQLMPELLARLPVSFNQYHEPFIGGGALFFELQPRKAILSDANEDLISLYRVIQNDVEDLIQELSKHVYEKEYFYKIRNADRVPGYDSWSDVERASRFIYLNRTCFNGLCRVNQKGQFNVPFGKYKNPKILDLENLLACHDALQGVELHCSSFESVENRIGSGDFVYFDPPYAPLTATSNFTSYTKAGFDTSDQVALRDLCRRLDARGIKFMVSNSSAPLILDLYQEFQVGFVGATRNLNSKGARRGKVKEVIVTNY